MREITIVIDENGDLMGLNTPGSEVFFDPESTITKRASHILPAGFLPRIAFRIIRAFVRDDSATAAWCRKWRGPWLVDTSPTAGVILPGRWMNRQDAINAEIEFLNDWFLRR